ncbi:MAG: hypothetical protein JW959_05315 [Pirellulales bacterium]|nr:hypothetical protein [Pirellulales bacterium]
MHSTGKKTRKLTRPPRRGYALMLTMFFCLLFLVLLGVAWRGTASALRGQSIRDLQTRRDEGTIHALARAMALLETGSPPSDPYVCGVTLTTSQGEKSFTVTFTGEGENLWAVQAAPTASGEDPTPMPDTFAPDS